MRRGDGGGVVPAKIKASVPLLALYNGVLHGIRLDKTPASPQRGWPPLPKGQLTRVEVEGSQEEDKQELAGLLYKYSKSKNQFTIGRR